MNATNNIYCNVISILLKQIIMLSMIVKVSYLCMFINNDDEHIVNNVSHMNVVIYIAYRIAMDYYLGNVTKC